VLLVAVAIGMALMRGRGDQQHAAPAAKAPAGTSDPVGELQLKVAARPDDSIAWRALGDAQFARGSYADAVHSLEKAAQVGPQSALLWSSLGEARVMASAHDPMPPEALADFRRAQAADPKDPRSRYFLAVKQDLDGDHKGAIAGWLALLKATSADAPWRSDLVRTIAQVGRINHIDVARQIAAASGPAPAASAKDRLPGPTPQDLASATAIPPGEQRQMARGMVERLQARLKADPRNADGWAMLIRSRAHLGETDKASQALRDAIAANPDEAAQLRTMAAALGVK
jgi:cytochrome c-type biogenesis protein CcmH